MTIDVVNWKVKVYQSQELKWYASWLEAFGACQAELSKHGLEDCDPTDFIEEVRARVCV